MFEESDQSGAARRLVATLVIAAASLLVLPAAAGAGVRSDFNGDGFEDLAIGIEGEDPGLPDSANSGAVEVIYGSATNLDPIGPPADQFWHEDSPGIESDPTSSEFFGHSLAAGS